MGRCSRPRSAWILACPSHHEGACMSVGFSTIYQGGLTEAAEVAGRFQSPIPQWWGAKIAHPRLTATLGIGQRFGLRAESGRQA